MIHTEGGEMRAEVHPDRLVLTAGGHWAGIAIRQAMKPGYSTCPDWITRARLWGGDGAPRTSRRRLTR